MPVSISGVDVAEENTRKILGLLAKRVDRWAPIIGVASIIGSIAGLIVAVFTVLMYFK